MEAIRTLYRGVSFRSRLEAKWARMFDLIGWKWEYEPFDLAGWIPDFVLIGTNDNSVLVEIKPILSLSEITNEMRKKWEDAMVKSGRRSDVLVLGVVGPGPDPAGWSGYSIGWLGELQDGDELWFLPAMLSKDEKGWDFFHPEGWFRHRLSGSYDGDGHLNTTDRCDEDQFDKWWAEATNATQWNRT